MPYYLNIKDLEMSDDNMNSSFGVQTDTISVTGAQYEVKTDFEVGLAASHIQEINDVVSPLPSEWSPKYKYLEDVALRKITNYVNSTYGQHYVGNGSIQTIDFWESLGSLETTCRDTAIKYLARYGKKGGKNEKDLLKAIHYIILMMYANESENDPERHGDHR